MCDIEFTIEQGKLWMLQTRVGKRTARAALKIAVDMVDEGLITREEAVLRIDPAQLDQLLHPQFDANAHYDVLAKGLNACPGAAVGEVVFTSADAVAAAEAGRKVILVRWETTPDDLHGMIAAQGILTSHGGKTSHAAVVARGMGKPCVCGAEKLKIDAEQRRSRRSAHRRRAPRGRHHLHRRHHRHRRAGRRVARPAGGLRRLRHDPVGWADEFRTMGVRANADTPDDAVLGRKFGATGIGLCRTEHMFLGERKQIVQDMIIAEDEAGAPPRSPSCSRSRSRTTSASSRPWTACR